MHFRGGILVAVATLCLAAPAFGQPERSLDACQREVSKGLGKYLAAQQKAVGNCLSRVAKNVISKDAPVAGAAKACGAQLNKLRNSANPGRTVLSKARTKIERRCDPTVNPALAHNQAQALALVPPGVPQGIEAKRLDSWCTYFALDPNNIPDWGDGSLDTIQEWLDCAFAITDCHARQNIVAQFPRLTEWLDELALALPALGPKFDDAVAELAQWQASIDPLGLGFPTINCGPGVDTCGDGIANGTDQCDGTDLDGASCATLGFKGGTLSCDAYCYFDFSGCIAGAFPATGQTTVWKADDDGDFQLGAPFNLTDNGDGTISDANSGLMWEKKSRDGGMHDQAIKFVWKDLFDVHLNRMNNTCDGFESNPALLTPCDSDADCIGIGNQLCGHAGFRDWRIPNRTELMTLHNLGKRNAATPPEFDTACPSNCTVLTCSCTQNNKYWTSTSYHVGPSGAWFIEFGDGNVGWDPKTTAHFVRAVRGGGF